MKNNMIITVLIILLFTAGMCFAGGEQDSGTETGGVKPLNLGFGAGAATGTWYLAGGYIGTFLADNSSLVNSVTVQVTAGSVENGKLIQAGEVDMAMMAGTLSSLAYRGLGPFSTEKVDKLRIMMRGHVSINHLIVLADSGINSIADLKGKRVVTGAAGSGVVNITRSVLALYGITPDDIDERFLTFKEATDALKDGKVDAINILAYYPSGIVESLASVRDIKLLSFDQEILDKLVIDKPGAAFGTIPANSYTGIDYPALSVDSGTVYCVSSDLPDEVVYQMTKTMYELQNELSEMHPVLKSIGYDADLNALNSIVPVHDGAKKYYQEIGRM
jgi:uncharacterized protein